MFNLRLLLVSGKGGVGRSAVTAALAMLGARRGLRVLALAMTDDLGLASHLGIDHLSHRPTEIRPGLNAAAVDRTRALDEYLRLQLHAPRIAPLGPISRGLNALADTVPGIRDIITIGKALHEAGRTEWDIVVTDSPPLGQLGSYLRAPQVIAGLVPVGRIRDQAASMEGELADSHHAGLVMVSVPEELPVVETMGAFDELTGLIAMTDVITNRMLARLPVSEEKLATIASDPHREAGLLHRSLFSSQQQWRAQLPQGPEVPYFFGVHTPGEAAALIAESLEDQV